MGGRRTSITLPRCAFCGTLGGVNALGYCPNCPPVGSEDARATGFRPSVGGTAPVPLTVRRRGEVVHVPTTGRSSSTRLVDMRTALGSSRYGGQLALPEFVLCLRCGRPLWGARSVILGYGPQCLVLDALETGGHKDVGYRPADDSPSTDEREGVDGAR